MKQTSVCAEMRGDWLGRFAHGLAAALFFTVLAAWSARALAEAVPRRPAGKRLLLFVGSNTLGERAMPALAKAYLEQEKKVGTATIQSGGEVSYVAGKLPDGPAVYIEIHATGSGDCFKSFAGFFSGADAPCDIGMSSRRIYENEAAALQQKLGSDFTQRGSEPGRGCEHPIAMDGLAIVVSQSNPLSRISFSQLHAIYSRKMVSWNQLPEWKAAGGGGEAAPILPVRRKEPSGTLDYFKERINPEPAPMSDETTITAFTSSEALAARVAATPGGIGFVGQGYAFASGLKRLQVYDDSSKGMMSPEDAVFPDPAAVHKGIYPLSRYLFLYTPSISLNAEVQPFIKFALSEAGQTVIADKGNLLKIEGTQLHITKQDSSDANAAASPAGPPSDRKKKVILRLHGSNTVGAECAVNLAFNYFAAKKQGAAALRIEDRTSALETPEGEKALAHDVMCDLHGDGAWETIEIRPTGSSDAFRDLAQGVCDIGMSSRPITDAERRDLLPVCGDLSAPEAQFALGIDAMAIIVSPESPAEKITVEQVRQVFLGEMTDWAGLGTERRPIQLYARPERSGTYKRFCDAVLFGRSVAGSAKRHAENSQLAEAVVGDRSGIGFVSRSQAGGAKMLHVGHDGSTAYYPPDEESVRAGRYPKALCRYVYLYASAEPPKSRTVEARLNWECAHEFAELSQSWQGQAIVAASGFIPDLNPIDEAGLAKRLPGEAIQKYLQRLSDLEKKV